MVQFIITDEGPYLNLSAIAKITPGPLDEKRKGRHTEDAETFKFYGPNGEELGRLSGRDIDLELMLAEKIPAAPGEKVYLLYYDKDESDETKRCWHAVYTIIAWAIGPDRGAPLPLTYEGCPIRSGGASRVVYERPDGKFDDIYTAVWDSLEAAMEDLTKERTA